MIFLFYAWNIHSILFLIYAYFQLIFLYLHLTLIIRLLYTVLFCTFLYFSVLFCTFLYCTVGANILTTEGAIFELLGDAKDPNFKAVSALLKERKSSSVNEFSMDTSIFWFDLIWCDVMSCDVMWWDVMCLLSKERKGMEWDRGQK